MLIGVTGLLKNQVIQLTEAALTVGRDVSNALVINDLSVSRKHCVIKGDADGYLVTDLGSHNGTFVNDIPVQNRRLISGDRIKIGNSLFILHLPEPQETGDAEAESPWHQPDRPIEWTGDEMVTRADIKLHIEDVILSMSRDLSTLLRISEALVATRDLNQLQHDLLAHVFEVTPAERGAILLTGDSPGEFESFVLYRTGPPSHNFRVSRTLAAQVVNDGVAVLGNNIPGSVAPRRSESLVMSEAESVLGVPLRLFGKTKGLIYLDTTDRRVCFDESHLRIVAAIANIAVGILENAKYIERLENANRLLRAQSDVSNNMVGESPAMREVYNFVARAAPADVTVLLTGESGTGKELVAHAIHRNSSRARQPFVAINCAVLTEPLLESELFGHEKGAFTGAFARKKGKLEMAQGGTVFLDEIGEMHPALQAKLLRVLQEREFERVGGTQPIKADVRFVAATNRDLEEETKRGAFRKDLFYRLNVLALKMPPLRDRREDVLLLAQYFIAKYAEKCKRHITGFSQAARARLLNYDWPGNVRELENAIERAIVMSTTSQIMPEDLPEALLEKGDVADGDATAGFYPQVKEAKRQLVLRALAAADNDYQDAAKSLGVHPNNLHRLIRNLDLKGEVRKFNKTP
jgi:transcriptional regulator with GAF, ATPase, and Fis domain